MVVVSRMMVLYEGPTETGSFYHVCVRDQRKRHLAGSTRNPKTTSTRTSLRVAVRQICERAHLCSMVGGPSMFGESRNSSGDCRWVQDYSVMAWWWRCCICLFRQCSKEGHSHKKAACSNELFVTPPPLPAIAATTTTAIPSPPPRAWVWWWWWWYWRWSRFIRRIIGLGLSLVVGVDTGLSSMMLCLEALVLVLSPVKLSPPWPALI